MSAETSEFLALTLRGACSTYSIAGLHEYQEYLPKSSLRVIGLDIELLARLYLIS